MIESEEQFFTSRSVVYISMLILTLKEPAILSCMLLGNTYAMSSFRTNLGGGASLD